MDSSSGKPHFSRLSSVGQHDRTSWHAEAVVPSRYEAPDNDEIVFIEENTATDWVPEVIDATPSRRFRSSPSFLEVARAWLDRLGKGGML
jgi:hypothetical protein